jgi:hypothetical protein
MSNPIFEGTIILLLQDTETGQIRRWPILLVERCQIESFMLGKRVICDNLIKGHKILLQVKILHKPWLSERDAVPHAPSFLPRFEDAPHLDGALQKTG